MWAVTFPSDRSKSQLDYPVFLFLPSFLPLSLFLSIQIWLLATSFRLILYISYAIPVLESAISTETTFTEEWY